MDPDRFFRSGEKIPKKLEARNPKYEIHPPEAGKNPKSEFPMFKTRNIPRIYP
jgi:hypothetical protein